MCDQNNQPVDNFMKATLVITLRELEAISSAVERASQTYIAADPAKPRP
jgi:hypothetical protein